MSGGYPEFSGGYLDMAAGYSDMSVGYLDVIWARLSDYGLGLVMGLDWWLWDWIVGYRLGWWLY